MFEVVLREFDYLVAGGVPFAIFHFKFQDFLARVVTRSFLAGGLLHSCQEVSF